MQEKQSEDTILDLVSWVDEHEKKVIRPLDGVSNWKGSLILLVAAIFIVVEVLNFLTSTNFDKIFTLLTLLVIFMAFISIVIQTTEQNALNAHLKNALRLKKFSDKEQPLLKALIKIKSKNMDLKLVVLYAMDKDDNGDTFTEKSLIQTICR